MIKGIVFDKDGTLLEFGPFWIPVARKAISRVLINHNCFNEDVLEQMLDSIGVNDGIRGLLCYGSYAEMCEKINEIQAKYTPDDILTYEEIADSFSESVKYGEIVPTCDNMSDFMSELKERDISIAVITTDNYEITKYTLQKLGIYEFIDKIYADDGTNPNKPNPYYMNCFMKDFSLDKSDICMVGDTLTDVRFAKNSGVKMIGVAKDDISKNILLSQTHTVVHDISNILEELGIYE